MNYKHSTILQYYKLAIRCFVCCFHNGESKLIDVKSRRQRRSQSSADLIFVEVSSLVPCIVALMARYGSRCSSILSTQTKYRYQSKAHRCEQLAQGCNAE